MDAFKKLIYIVIIGLMIGALFFMLPEIEWHSPSIDIKLSTEYVGLKPFDIEINDQGKGLKDVTVLLIDEYGESVLVNKNYPQGVNRDNIRIELDHKKLGIKDGNEATIRVTATDRSRIKIFSGNKSSVDKKVIIDVNPPELVLFNTEHYINHGGSGFIIYKASSDTYKSGVKVGEFFFPGYKGYYEDPDVYMAFFAYPYNLDPDKIISVIAEDKAGNVKESSFFYRLKRVPYRKSSIDISDRFIKSVIVPLLNDNSNVKEDLRGLFLLVNRDLREKNDKQIVKITKDSQDRLFWSGPFHQLSRSKVEANFADKRAYFYNGEQIDKQYHLGYDLAVTRRYPVEAANNGLVIYAGELGIYGNTVIIDHGMGISTLYGHLSSIDVKEGEMIKKNHIIGRTGQTGLAGGDHLHFGVYVNGIPVRPIEWWDRKWIADKVTTKKREAELEFGVSTSDNLTQGAH